MRAIQVLPLATILWAALHGLALQVHATDWRQFRGPAGSGVAPAAELPTDLSLTGNLRWKVAAGGGTSSPVVIADRVYLTSFDGAQRLVTCYAAKSGEIRWTKSLPAERKEIATAPGGAANPSPVVDETSVFVLFPDIGVVCFSHEGVLRWQVALGPFHSFHGLTASLVLADGKVIVLVDQLQDSFLLALDSQTGGETWRVARPDGPIGGYSTPVVRPLADGASELIVSGPLEVVGYDAATGQRRWAVGGVTNAPISVPVVGGGQVFVCEPSFSQNPFKIDSLLVHDKNQDGELSLDELESQVQLWRIARLIDKNWGNGDGKINAAELERAFESFVGGGGLVAIGLPAAAGATLAKVNWAYRKSVPQIPSLLYCNDLLFFINDGGIFTAVDPANGEFFKRGRLNHGAKFYASPVAAGGKIVLIDTAGKLSVVSALAQWEILATGDLQQECYATPAIANGCLYIRGGHDLFCFGDQG